MTEAFTRNRVAVACAALAVALSATVHAQTAAQAPRPTALTPRADPADARSEVPRIAYRSPMQGYRPYADTEPAPWVETNNTVNRIGGWRVYAKEARQPDAPEAPAAASAPASMPNRDAARPQPAGHQGHKMN